MEKYKLTDEHRAQLKPWSDKWIANAMSTKAMDDEDKITMKKAIKGLYESAGLTPPPEHRIVFVPSPFVARFAGGFAAAIWWLRKNKTANVKTATADATIAATADATAAATYDAIDAATRAATYDAIDAATADATRAATYDAIDAATRAATRAATYDAIDAATRAATYAATRAATYDATYDAIDAATRAATAAATYAATIDATIDETIDAIDAATADATADATRAATYDAIDAATRAATYAATRAATAAATYDAIDAATRAATAAATYAATRDAIENKKSWFKLDVKALVKLSFDLKIGQFGLRCAKESSRMYQGGNQWSSWVGFISFFRHVAKLDIDYSKWDHWEKAAIHGSYRIMNPEFCIISDRPKTLLVDEQNRPHNFDGPFCEWRDGSALYSIHGVRVPMWIVETKRDEFTKEMILSETNADYRRCIIQKIGIEKTIELLGAEVIDEKTFSVGGTYQLLNIDYDNSGEKRPYLKMENPSLKLFHIEGVDKECKTVEQAIMYRNGLKQFTMPEVIS